MMFDKTLPYDISIWLEIIYPKIRNLLKIPKRSDFEVLAYFRQKGIIPKKTHISPGLKAICFGAAPNLESYKSILPTIVDEEVLICTADGATRWILEEGVFPDLVVTDLDGLTHSDISEIINHDVSLQVLIHGDNRKKVEHFQENFDINQFGNISFVTQGPTQFGFETSLGFTDGDRLASFLCQHNYQPLLLGYNLQSEYIGRYSKPEYTRHQPMTDRKKVKLEIAKNILDWLNFHFNLYTEKSQFCPGTEITITNYLNM